MLLYLRFVLIGLGCAFTFTTAQAGQSTYRYLSAQYPPESFWMIRDHEQRDEYSLIFTDVEYDHVIEDGSKPNEPIIVWERGSRFRLYIPENFSKELENWNHGECAFDKVAGNWFDRDDPVYIIESQCDDNRNARYHYSVRNGLQLILFGSQEVCGLEYCPFHIDDAYFLYNSSKGFGAKSTYASEN